MTLREAGDNLATAHRAHADAFLRYKTLDPKRTDGVARAMADLDVDLTRAEAEWEIAKRELDNLAMEFEITRLNFLIGETDATEPDPSPQES
jgi:hypothetical protein